MRHVDLYPDTDIQTQRMFMCGEAEYEELQKSENDRNYIADPLTYFKCMLMLSSDYVKTKEKGSNRGNVKSHDDHDDYDRYDYYDDYDDYDDYYDDYDDYYDDYDYSYYYDYDDYFDYYEYYEYGISSETTSTPGPFVSHPYYPNNYENDYEKVGLKPKYDKYASNCQFKHICSGVDYVSHTSWLCGPANL